MPSDKQKREAVKGAYLKPNWHERVDKMSDAQVAAIHQRLLDQKKIK